MAILRDVKRQLDTSDEPARTQHEVVTAPAELEASRAEFFDLTTQQSSRTAGGADIAEAVDRSLRPIVVGGAQNIAGGLNTSVNPALTELLGGIHRYRHHRKALRPHRRPIDRPH